MNSSNTDSNEQLYPVSVAAVKLGVSVRTLQQWERDGKIAATRTLGGHRRIAQSEIDRILAGAVQ